MYTLLECMDICLTRTDLNLMFMEINKKKKKKRGFYFASEMKSRRNFRLNL